SVSEIDVRVDAKGDVRDVGTIVELRLGGPNEAGSRYAYHRARDDEPHVADQGGAQPRPQGAPPVDEADSEVAYAVQEVHENTFRESASPAMHQTARTRMDRGVPERSPSPRAPVGSAWISGCSQLG